MKTNKTKTIKLRIDETLFSQFQAKAKANGSDISKTIRQLITSYTE